MQENIQEKSPIKKRILQYLELKGITKYSFYKASGVSRNTLDQPTGISEDNLARFLKYAQDISPIWVLTGQGDVFNTGITRNATHADGGTKGCCPELHETPPFDACRSAGAGDGIGVGGCVGDGLDGNVGGSVGCIGDGVGVDGNVCGCVVDSGVRVDGVSAGIRAGVCGNIGDVVRVDSGIVVEHTFPLLTDRCLEVQTVPLYELSATAGLVELFTDDFPHVPLCHVVLPNLPPCDGALSVRGDSMYPLLKSGDIVLYKEVRDIENGIFWGEMYLVSLATDDEDYIAIKYVHRSEKEGFVRLVSHNSHHSPKEVPLSGIRALALIKASVRYNTMG